MVASWDLIASQTLTVDTTTVTFASISSAYDGLVVTGNIITNNSSIYTQASKRFSGDTAGNYMRTALYIDAGVASLSSQNESNERFAIVDVNDGSYTNSFSNFELWIDRYKSTSYKKFDRTIWTRLPNDGSLGLTGIYGGQWKNTSTAINQISIYDPTGTADWKTGSTFYLYGITYS